MENSTEKVAAQIYGMNVLSGREVVQVTDGVCGLF